MAYSVWQEETETRSILGDLDHQPYAISHTLF